MVRCLLPIKLASIVLILLLVGGCGGGAPDVPETSLELPSIIEPVPSAPTPADENLPGTWEALPALAEPARAFVVEPEIDERGGLVLVHGGWGVSDRVRDLARRLADEGFAVVVPDLFEGVVSTSRLSREPLIKGVEPPRAAELIRAALQRLDEAGFDAGSRALLGVGAGGNWLTLALGEGLEASLFVLDTTVIAPETLPETLSGSTLDLLVGDRNNSFGPDRIEAMVALVAERGGTLEVRRVEGAGTTLFDERALGFSGLAYDYAISAVKELAGESLRAPAD